MDITKQAKLLSKDAYLYVAAVAVMNLTVKKVNSGKVSPKDLREMAHNLVGACEELHVWGEPPQGIFAEEASPVLPKVLQDELSALLAKPEDPEGI